MKTKNTKLVIQQLDLDRIIKKLTSSDTAITHLTKPWSRRKSLEAVQQYKRYLWIIYRYQKKYKFLPPSAEIDLIWHAHILDTKAYAKDCQKIFGRLLHHNPYFGLNGKKDRKNLIKAFQETQNLYQQEFGEPIYSLEDM